MLLALSVLVIPIIGCGSNDEPDTEPVTFEAWAGSVITDYNPATSLVDLSTRSTVVTEATLVDIEDGAIFGSSSDHESASHSVNLIFETDAGDRYYVERPRPAYMAIDELRSVMPLGAASVIYLQPNNDPRDQNFFNVREGPTWFFTTPQGWILDDPERGIGTPLEGLDMLGFEPPADGDTNLRAWLVDSQTSSSTVSVPDDDREALIATGDPAVVLDCPEGRLPLPSPAYEYAEDTPLFDTAVEAVEWWLANAYRDALRVSPDDVTVLDDVEIPVEIVRSPDDLTTQHFYVPALVEGRVQVVFGASYDMGPEGLVVNEIVACEGVGLG
jgi:hypothetical protein